MRENSAIDHDQPIDYELAEDHRPIDFVICSDDDSERDQ